MTPLSPARRAADEFASVVDGARGEAADRYADLLTYVDVLRTQEAPAQRPDFAASLRERLMEAADTLLVSAEPEQRLATVIDFKSARPARQRRIGIAAAALIVVGGTASVAAAAEHALPGDPLYGLKRGIESAQISFNSSDSGKGQDMLSQASTRLQEINGLLAAHGSNAEVAQTLSSFQSSASNGADLIFVSYQNNGDPAEITRLRAILASQLNQLDSLSTDAPGTSATQFGVAKALVTQLDQQARVLCGACGPDAGLSDTLTPTSAPALTSLLTVPAAAIVPPSVQAAGAKHLADLANHLAHEGTSKSSSGSTGPLGGLTAITPSLPVPGSPTATGGALGSGLGEVTGGVGALLQSLTAPLTPVTDALGLTDTLGGLTKGATTPTK
jgi:hypothetical protein